MHKIRKAGALIIHDKRLLIVRAFGKPFYTNPGGKYEDGEDAEKCLQRELMEELQIALQSFDHFKTYEVDRAAFSKNPLSLELYFVSYSGDLKPSSEIEIVEWMSKVDFDNKKFDLAPSFYTYVPELIEEGLL